MIKDVNAKTILHNTLHEASSAGEEILEILQTSSGQEATATQDLFALNSPVPAHDALQRPLKELAEAATRLLQFATDPRDYLPHLAANYQHLVCLKWLISLEVLKHIPLLGKVSYSQLASSADVPESQLKGVARMAMVHGFLHEPEPGTVAHSRSSALLVKDESFMNWARWMTNYSAPTAYQFPEATKRWGNTEAKNETAFNLAMDVRQPFFDHLRQQKEMNTMFSGYMRNVASTEGVSFKHLVNGFDWAKLPSGATVVDVGGSTGHGSIALAKQYPHLKFIVQDLPETIANAKKSLDSSDVTLSSRIDFMAHDFFQRQPVTDADVYLLRMIIHDWPDAEATKILEHLKKSLNKPDARILIMDTVLPQPGTIPILQERQLRVRDLTMMQVFNAKEREIEDWKQLTRSAGLQILHVEQPLGSNMGILQVAFREEVHVNGVHSSTSIVANGDYDGHVKSSHEDDHVLDGISLPINGNIENVNATQKSDRNQMPILIIGAGIGGLCLAQGLRKAGIDFLVFERDLSEAYRPQGYRLKLEADASEALRESLPDSVYKAFELSCAVSAVGETDYDPISGVCIRSRAGGGLSGRQGLRASYTVDRATFRSVLMTGIEDRVIFGRELTSYESRQDTGTVTAKFRDGSQAAGCLLVGADGSRSIIRKQHLPKHKFVDTGAMCIYGKTTITPALLQRYPKRALQWMTVCTDRAPLIQSILIGDSPLTLLSEPIRFEAQNRAQMQQLPEDYVYWVLIGRKEIFTDASSGNAAEVATLERGPEESARQSLELTKEWDSSLRSIFEMQDVQQCSTLRVASATPEIPCWDPSSTVTLIGDSIHAMSPCGGVGANTALRDAAELARLIADGGVGALTAERVGMFEKDLRKRAFGSLMRSFAGSKKMFDQRPFDDLQVLDM
ncbi:hypothetical protein EV356DRAFT_536266 [Viridothelium virens]|uniref:O-methyltransferase n=1 Tax=Viridothelium virens TaxID=1048519 RepID=A0A6A6GY59_VIRVR|nr:hypothetical protein EV356DRAFT_536266 [Viridothelium virens]